LPGNQPFIKLLLQHGLQQPDGSKTDLGTTIGKQRQNTGRRHVT
jgi:hypothetical protein